MSDCAALLTLVAGDTTTGEFYINCKESALQQLLEYRHLFRVNTIV